MTKTVGEETLYRVLRALHRAPELSQRALSNEAGVSLGCVNYCLKALAEKGLIKIRNFQKSDHKLNYAYVLTPKGLQEKTQLTRRFLQRKTAEYEALRAELQTLQAEISETDEAKRR